jgi:prepilin-type N-terminal cleavage/methylation domain-containing protein
MNKKLMRGFTLIELLVVIAIIGILAALVLVALGNARAKAQDARIKSDIAQLRTLAEVVYDSNNASYETGANGVETCFETPTAAECFSATTSTNVQTLIDDINTANGTAGGLPTAEATASGFCVEAQMNDANFICADSTGRTATAAAASCAAAADVTC